MDQIKIRTVSPNDTNFIISTWLNHYKNNSYFAKKIRKPVFYYWHELIVKNILAKKSTSALVVCPNDDDEVLLGYLISEKIDTTHIIHFCLVKQEFRRFGIAKKLLAHAQIDPRKSLFTHWTYDLDELMPKLEGIIYDPYRI